jgi:hypothetical protein
MVPHAADIHGARAGRTGREKLLHHTEDCRKTSGLLPE